MKNTWHKDQDRGKNNTFKPNWTVDTVKWVIEKIGAGDLEEIDIKYQLVKDYDITMASASLWLEMCKRIKKDVDKGSSLETAIETDRQRRNKKRRKPKLEYLD